MFLRSKFYYTYIYTILYVYTWQCDCAHRKIENVYTYSTYYYTYSIHYDVLTCTLYSAHSTITAYATDPFQLFMCSISRWISSYVSTRHILYCVRVYMTLSEILYRKMYSERRPPCAVEFAGHTYIICYCHPTLLLLFLNRWRRWRLWTDMCIIKTKASNYLSVMGKFISLKIF